MSRWRLITSTIAALYFLALIGFTFMRTPDEVRESWAIPFILFLPVGLMLALLMGPRRWWAAIAFSVLGAAWIEAAQSIWMPEGYARTSDLMLATFGGLVGVAAGILLALPASRAARSHEAPSIVTQSGNREVP
jgi:glycopeptide antibiotics resistance protein